MLEEKDLQAIQKMIDAAEQRIAKNTEAAIDAAEQRIAKSTVLLMDAEFSKKFNLLAEGQQTILETLAPKSRVEALEDEVAFMKQVIRTLSRDVAELKKAQ